MKEPIQMAVGVALLLVHASAAAVERGLADYQDQFAYEYFVQLRNIPTAKKGSQYSELQGHFAASGDLVITFLDRSATKTAHRALAYMTLLGLDLNYARDQNCAVYKRGKAMLSYLEEAKRAFQSGKCELPESRIKVAPHACGSKDAVMKSLEMLISGIKNGFKCDEPT